MSNHQTAYKHTRWLLVALSFFLLANAIQADDRVEYPTVETEQPLPEEVVNFVKAIVVAVVPPTYTDDDDWGAEKRIQSGLNVDLDGLKIRTSRRWKDVNHGTWRRVDAVLVDPANRLDLQISALPTVEGKGPRYRIRSGMRVRAIGRQQQWNLGVKLYSLSAEAVADIRFSADVEIRSEFIKHDGTRKLRVMPQVEAAAISVDGFRLREVSKAKGSVVREFSNAVEAIVRRAVKRKNQKLVAKLNGKIAKKPERFEIPASLRAVLGVESK